MDYIIFFISVVGIIIISYIMDNKQFLDYEKSMKTQLKIVIIKDNVDYVEKKQIINKVMTGNYNNILEIVDNVRIN